MLGLLGGLSDLEGPAERVFRFHRTRSARASKPDSDHTVPDLHHGSFLGNSGASLASQETPRHVPVAAGPPARRLTLEIDWAETPLPAASTVDLVSRATGTGGARAPPPAIP